MKKVLAAAAIAALMMSLAACNILYDEADTEFSDPGSSSTDQPLNKDNNNVSGDSGIVGTKYVANGFSFQIPAGWRERIVAEKYDDAVGGVNATIRDFFFKASDGETRVLMMRILQVSAEDYPSLGIGTLMCKSSDEKTYFVNYPITVSYPSSFTEINEFMSVYETLGSTDFELVQNK